MKLIKCTNEPKKIDKIFFTDVPIGATFLATGIMASVICLKVSSKEMIELYKSSSTNLEISKEVLEWKDTNCVWWKISNVNKYVLTEDPNWNGDNK